MLPGVTHMPTRLARTHGRCFPGWAPALCQHGLSEDHQHRDHPLIPLLDTVRPRGELTKQVKHPERGLFSLPSALKRISMHGYPRRPRVKLLLSARESAHLLPTHAPTQGGEALSSAQHSAPVLLVPALTQACAPHEPLGEHQFRDTRLSEQLSRW